jgi:sugar lactone lactonase YvrE
VDPVDSVELFFYALSIRLHMVHITRANLPRQAMPAEIPLSAVSFTGSNLARPECVLATRAGDLYASDRRGGVSHIAPDGMHRLYAGGTLDLKEPLLPNGIALDRDGSFLIAHLSDSEGGVFRLQRDGQVSPVLRQVDGQDLHVTNFVLRDAEERLWVSISTRTRPRIKSFRPDVADGYIVLLDRRGARVVADGIGFTNETRITPDGQWLYVNETWGKRLTRFRVGPDGALSGRETVAELGDGEYPDGLALDAEGAVWITCVVSNRLLRITPDGRKTVYLEDFDPAHVAEVEAASRAGRLERPVMDRHTWAKLPHIASIAFGGPDLKTAYLGVLLGDRLPTLRLPVAGAPLVHW